MADQGNRLISRRDILKLAGLVGGTALLEACSPSPTAADTKKPSIDTTPKPTLDSITKPLTQAEIDAKVKELELPANLEATALVSKVLDVDNDWINSGANADTPYAYDHTPGAPALTDLIASIAARNATPHVIALFGKDWKTNPIANKWYASSIATNKIVLSEYMSTQGDKEPYKLLLKLGAVLSETKKDNTRTIVMTYRSTDNSDMNSAKVNLKNEQLTLTFETDGAVEHMTNVVAASIE